MLTRAEKAAKTPSTPTAKLLGDDVDDGDIETVDDETTQKDVVVEETIQRDVDDISQLIIEKVTKIAKMEKLSYLWNFCPFVCFSV